MLCEYNLTVPSSIIVVFRWLSIGWIARHSSQRTGRTQFPKGKPKPLAGHGDTVIVHLFYSPRPNTLWSGLEYPGMSGWAQ